MFLFYPFFPQFLANHVLSINILLTEGDVFKDYFLLQLGCTRFKGRRRGEESVTTSLKSMVSALILLNLKPTDHICIPVIGTG